MKRQDSSHCDTSYLKTMWFIWIAQDIHRICYVYNYGPPRGKAGQRVCRELWPDFTRRRLDFSYCLNVDPRFYHFLFFVFFQKCPKVPGRNPAILSLETERSDYFYPGSEDFSLKIQFPCYRYHLFAPFISCVAPLFPLLLYYRRRFVDSSSLFTFIYLTV